MIPVTLKVEKISKDLTQLSILTVFETEKNPIFFLFS